ncbi:MAG: hypothetical protein K6A40_00535 [Solobacterium sp.]|nr:hypothetical protein [Solobacterium sp.]
MEKESQDTIFQDGDFLLRQSDGTYYVSIADQTYLLSDHLYEPYLSMKSEKGMMIIHNAFTLDELCRCAKTDGTVEMITGNAYNMKGICRLLRKAAALSRDSVDIGYLEGCCFLDLLADHGAFSEETAADPSSCGMKNPRLMQPFLHSKKACCTKDGRFYLPGKSL